MSPRRANVGLGRPPEQYRSLCSHQASRLGGKGRARAYLRSTLVGVGGIALLATCLFLWPKKGADRQGPAVTSAAEVVFIWESPQRTTCDLYRVRLAGGLPTQITTELSVATDCTHNTHAQRLAFSSWGPRGRRRVSVVDVDGQDLATVSQLDGDSADPAWRPDGAELAFSVLREGYRAIYVIDARGVAAARQLSKEQAQDMHPMWSPDGKRVVFTRAAGRSTGPQFFSRSAIICVDRNGQTETELVPADALNEDPCWSPDGKALAFTSAPDGDFRRRRIHLVNADGTGRRQLTREHLPHEDPIWSPDGSKILFSSGMPNSCSLCMANSDGSDLRRLTNAPGNNYQAVWTPDGNRIVFLSDRNRTYGIYMLDSDGSNERCLVSSKRFLGKPLVIELGTPGNDGRKPSAVTEGQL